MNEQNRSLAQLRETIEMNNYSIQNISERLSVFDTERQTNIAAIDANSEELLKLGLDINATRNLHNELEAKVWNIEGSVFSVFLITAHCVEGKIESKITKGLIINYLFFSWNLHMCSCCGCWRDVVKQEGTWS